jgi:AcrR family transcriptional regulator
MQEVIGTREATKRETRRALLEAALSEFASRGFDAPSLDAICARAGFTRGAFYVHFSNRDELVSAAMEHAIATFVERIMPDGNAVDDIAAVISVFADVIVPDIQQALAATKQGEPSALIDGLDALPVAF